MTPIFYDLTELFLLPRGKFHYYGIARVVSEIAYEIPKIDPNVRFVVYSQGHRSFFEVFPRTDDTARNGFFETGIPDSAAPHRIRAIYHSKSPVRDILVSPVQAVARAASRWSWRKSGQPVRPVDLSGAHLFAAGRPKLIVDYVSEARRTQTNLRLHVLLHDMIPLHGFSKNDHNQFTSNFFNDNRYLVEYAAQIIANSRFTLSEIQYYSKALGLPGDYSPACLPLAHELRKSVEPATQAVPGHPFILCVGGLVGRKNLECVFDALCDLHGTGRFVPHLVLAGAHRAHIVKYLRQEKYASILPKICYVHNPNQTDLTRLYQNALALVLPSRIEGWGLPAGEALWLGTPVICSTAPVLREVCGDLGLYFDPDSSEGLANQIDRLSRDPAFDADTRQRITAAKSELRSWRIVARELLNLVKSAQTQEKSSVCQ